MKKFGILGMLALQLAVCSCGNTIPTTVVNTQAAGSWEAQLTGGKGQTSLLNFVVAFNVVDQGPLDITGFSFINDGACFSNGTDAETETGSANFGTGSTDQVMGTLGLTITSATNSNVLTLGPGNLTGTSNGTTTTTGSLSNGIVVGTWSLASSDPKCLGGSTSPVTGDFVMCQGAATCSTTGTQPPPASKP